MALGASLGYLITWHTRYTFSINKPKFLIRLSGAIKRLLRTNNKQSLTIYGKWLYCYNQEKRELEYEENPHYQKKLVAGNDQFRNEITSLVENSGNELVKFSSTKIITPVFSGE